MDIAKKSHFRNVDLDIAKNFFFFTKKKARRFSRLVDRQKLTTSRLGSYSIVCIPSEGIQMAQSESWKFRAKFGKFELEFPKLWKTSFNTVFLDVVQYQYTGGNTKVIGKVGSLNKLRKVCKV